MKRKKSSVILLIALSVGLCGCASIQSTPSMYLYSDLSLPKEKVAVIRPPLNDEERTKLRSKKPHSTWFLMRLVSIIDQNSPQSDPVAWTGFNAHVLPGKYVARVQCETSGIVTATATFSVPLQVAAGREYVLDCEGKSVGFSRIDVTVLWPGATPEELALEKQEQRGQMPVWQSGVLDKVKASWDKPTDMVVPIHCEIRAKFGEDGRLLNLSWITPTENASLNRSIINAFKDAAPFSPPPDADEARNNGVAFVFSEN